MKNKAVLMVLFLLVVSLTATTAMAVHDSTVSWQTMPSQVWEFSENNFIFSVSNGPSPNNLVSNVSVNVSPLSFYWIDDQYDLLNTSDFANWFDLSLGLGSLGFTFNATAPQVDANTSYIFEVEVVDAVGNISYHNLSVTVLNDSIAPYYVLNAPGNRAFVKLDDVVNFNVTYGDDESGVAQATLYYRSGNDISWAWPKQSELVSDSDGFFTRSFTSSEVSMINPYITFFYEIQDKAGNYLNKESSSYAGPFHGLFIDFEKPVVDLAAPADYSFTNANTRNFYFDATDDSAISVAEGFEPNLTCTLNFESADLGSYVGVANFTNGFVSGNISTYTTSDWYSWNVVCVDESGRSNVSQTYNLGIDRVDPVVSPLFDTPTEVILNGTYLQFTVTDDFSNVSTVWYNTTNSSNDQIANATLAFGLNNASVNFAIDTSAWEYGPHTLNISARDRAGNIVVETYTIIIDNKPPVFDTLLPADGDFAESEFFFNATDEYSPIEDPCILTINGTQHNISLLTWKAVTLADGTYSWNITCSDDLGNANTSQTRTVYVDNTLPTFVVNNAVEGVVNQDFVFMNFTVVEANPMNTTFCLFNATDLVDIYFNATVGVLTHKFSGLVDGVYQYNVTSEDLAGNTNATATYTITLDTIAPQFANITQLPVGELLAQDTFTVSVDLVEANPLNTTVFVYNASGLVAQESFGTQNGVVSFILADGDYQYNITSVDLAGNHNDSLTYNVTVDTTAPTVTIVEPTDAINVNDSLVNFTINYTDANAGVCEFYVDGELNATSAATNPLTFQYNFTDSNNAHSWYVRCNDSAGNWYNINGSTQNNTIYYDTTVPVFGYELNASTQPIVDIQAYSARFVWNASELTNNTVEINNTGNVSQDVLSQNASVTFTGLNENTAYTYRVWSCDAAGIAGDTTHCTFSDWFTFTTKNDPSNDPVPSSSSSSPSRSFTPVSSVVENSSSDGACTSEWTCSEWSACANGEQVRTCTDVAECFNAEAKPLEKQSCEDETQDADAQEGNLLTGNVVGESKGPSLGEKIVVFTFLGIVLFGSLGYTLYRRVNRKTKY